MLPALAALWLVALPGVSRASSLFNGYGITATTATWTGTSSCTGTTFSDTGGDGVLYMAAGRCIRAGYGGSAPGTLNQAGGRISALNPTYECGVGDGVTGYWNMSGSAVFETSVKDFWLGNQGSGSGTWSLTDSASATVAALYFKGGTNNNRILLSGAATLSATDLVDLTGVNEYISFASGCAATLTVANKSLSDFTTLVSGGFIRVDGVKQTDFSKFQVVGHSLSLFTGGPTPPHLVITDVSPASATAGTGFDVTVETQNDSNTPVNVTADTAVTLTLKTGTGTLGGTTIGTISNGTSLVTISGVTYTKAESGVVLTASADSLAADDSAPFTVVPGTPAKLAFGVQPSDTGTGWAISPAVTVLVQDANGNTVTNNTSSVTIGSGSTAFAGDSTLTVSAVAGVATFTNLKPTTEGSGKTLTASDGALTGATSSAFIVGADTVQDWFATGSVSRSSDRTITRYLSIGYTAVCTLNQTAGTITWTDTSNDQASLGDTSAASGTTWNMSGSAHLVFAKTTSTNSKLIIGLQNANNCVWSLTDSATASVGPLTVGATTATGSKILLAGGATLSAATLTFGSGANNYISFATGSTATFTAGNKVLADYQALVSAGNIRIDGVVQTDFTKFQVTADHTLSLATGAGADYNAWVALYPGFTDTNPTHDPDGDGMSNQQEYAFGLDPTKGSSANPIVAPLDKASGQFSYTRRATSGFAYTVEYSTDLAAWNPATLAGPESVGTPDSYGVETVTVTITNEPVNGKLFVRVRAE